MRYAFAPHELSYPVKHRPKIPFSPRAVPPANFDDTMAEITRLDRALDRFYLSAPDYLDLLQDATAANVHWSTKIEGNPLSAHEVGGTTRSALSLQPRTDAQRSRPHQEVINHLVVWLRPEMFARPWKVSTLQMVHRILMSGVDPTAHPGLLRGPNQDVDIRFEDGTPRFRAAPGARVQVELESLIEWTNSIAPVFRPVVAATLLFHEFESIHPFIDGNGRFGRVLFHAYLQRNGLRNSHLCIIEPHVVADRDRYLDLLTWADAKEDYTPLLDHIANSILQAYQATYEKMKSLDLYSGNLNETAKTIMVNARRHQDWFSIKDATDWIQGTEQTARIRIHDLCDANVLEERGSTRNKRFRFANPLRPFLESTQDQVDAAARAVTNQSDAP